MFGIWPGEMGGLASELYLAMSLTHALKWSFLAELAAKAIQPMVFIVLASLLTPEDFGVMTAALMVIGFSQIFWEAGMGKALIQRQSDVDDAANVAFWINIGLGLFIGLLLFMAAKPIALTFFHDERVFAVIQVMTLQILMGAISSVHTALIQKELGFKKLFWVRLATVSLPGAVSIPLALNGMSYWALVAGVLTGQVSSCLMLWKISGWRPCWSFKVKIAKEMSRFAVWVGLSGLLAWFYVWADSLVIGMYLGNHDLGLYRTGNQLTIMVYAIVFGPISAVLYSYLSRIRQDKVKLSETALKVIKSLILIAVPVALILFSFSQALADTLFGEKWQGIGFVIGVMAFTHGLAWIVGMNGEFFRAIGKPSYETIATSIAFTMYIAGYLYSIRFGFEAFVWTRLILVIFGVAIQFLILNTILTVSFLSCIRYLMVVLILNCSMLYLTQKVLIQEEYPIWINILNGGLGFFLTVYILYLIEKNGIVKDIMLMIKKELHKC